MSSGINWKLKVKLPLCKCHVTLAYTLLEMTLHIVSAISCGKGSSRATEALLQYSKGIRLAWSHRLNWRRGILAAPLHTRLRFAPHVGNSVVMFSWCEPVRQDKLPKSLIVLHSELSLTNSAADAASWNRPTKHVGLRKAEAVGWKPKERGCSVSEVGSWLGTSSEWELSLHFSRYLGRCPWG